MKKCTLLYNPDSGKKNFSENLPYVEEFLSSIGFTCNIVRTEYPGHATELVKKALTDRPELFVIAGGDGTLHEALNGLAPFDDTPKIGYIPAGTSCDLGKTLGIPKNISKALEIIRKDVCVNMDVVKTNFGYFTYVSGIGSYIDISYKTSSEMKRFFGYMAYILMGVKEFFTVPKMKITIEHDKGITKGKYTLLLVVNSKKVAGFKLVNRPVLDDGRIVIKMYKYTPLLNNVLYFFGFLFNPRYLPRVTTIKTTKAVIDPVTERRWNHDGEASGSGRQELEVIRKALPIIINPKRLVYFKHQER